MSGMEALFFAASGAKMISTIAGGENAEDVANAEAKSLRKQALRTEALSQREAIAQAKKARLVASSALAAAGASGAGVDDPTVVQILKGIEDQGEFNKLAALYDGTIQGNTMRLQADITKTAGKQAKQGAYLTSIADMGQSLYAGGAIGGPPKSKAPSTGGSATAEWGKRGGYSLAGGLS